jgi:regulator of cell morphogenesis and NO signaling
MTTTTTLASLATTHPAASRVFKRSGLDYCCGGGQTLADACAKRGIDPREVLTAIAAEEETVDLQRWDTAPLGELVAFIVHRYHDSLRTELPALIAMADRVERRHAATPGCPTGLRDLLECLHERVIEHIEKEERVLFPLILGHCPGIDTPVHVLLEEHDEHGRDLNSLRLFTNGYTAPPQACPTWRALYLRLDTFETDLMQHIHLENHVLFTRALQESESRS